MDNDSIGIIVPIVICITIIIGMMFYFSSYNSTSHSDDVEMTEWISPDGVHYWYANTGYQGYLAPRYDSNGELVITK